jgi:hypothetical protein
MIDNFDLKEIASQYRIPLNDVFLKDRPPAKVRAGGYIINLQDATLNQGGSHWVALFVPPKQKMLGYMDSFGFPPSQSTINWLKSTSYSDYPIAYNTKQIQNIRSGGCGIYSMFFIDFMTKHRTDQKIDELVQKYSDLFSDDPEENLSILKSLVPYYKTTPQPN